MNISQKDHILTQIDEILSFDFDDLILKNNTTDNVDDIFYGEYSVSEFKDLYHRTFNQLKSELEDGLGMILPNTINTGSEFGGIDLYNEIGQFLSYLKQFAKRNTAASHLRRFIYYQIFHGFWDRSSVKQHRLDGLKIKHAEERIELVSKDLAERLEQFKSLKEEFEKSQLSIDDANLKYEQKLLEIEQAEKGIGEKADEIESLLSKSKDSEEQISNIQDTYKDQLASIKENKRAYEDDYKLKLEQFEIINERIGKLEKDNQRLNEQLIEEYEFIKSKEDEINKLVGLAADGSLGYKFNERKKNLERYALIWAISTAVASVASIIWIYLVFTDFSSDLGVPWVNLVVNAIKTSPAWLLVGFCIAQYKKERDYQEQYAFKSAVAMTITSYSDMLSNNKQEDISIKESLLLQAVNNIYDKPTIVQEKNNVTEKSLEQAKGLIASAVDLLKNSKS